MAEPFSRYLNSVAKLDSYLRNLLKLNKELSDANHKLRSQLGTFEVREQARERIIKDLEMKLEKLNANSI